MYADNELLFPPYVVPRLRNSRGETWQKLVDRVVLLPQDDPESLGFSLLMIHLNGCLRCETDSYRAMRGCTACARQTLRRYKEPDQELVERYELALEEIQAYLHAEPVQHVLERAPSAKAA
ncbi:MAG TPA: hypothetical protein G4O11_03860 [Anaerolineae bacterium]|nr:hypothetical protein [Anaerolineae bacterium]